MKESIYNAINNIIHNPFHVLTINSGQLKVIPKPKNNSNSDNKTEVINFLKQHKSEIQEIFNEAYFKGIDVIKFQNCINTFYNSSETPNFLKETTSNWTSLLQKKGIEIQLLLGTHDSGANSIDFSQRPAFMDNTGKKILYFFMKLPGVKTIVKNWTINQEHSILEQLENGIRLFDFRLGKSSDGTLYLSHTLLTIPFDKVIEQLENFMIKHPEEKIVIHLKNDHEYRKCITSEDTQKAKEQITNISTKFENFTLKNNIYEEWPNETEIKNVKAYMNETVYNKNSYLSLNTTPNGSTIFKNLFTGSLIKNGKKIQEQLGEEAVKILTQKKAYGIIVDSPNPKFIQHVISSNYNSHNNIIDEFKEINNINDEEYVSDNHEEDISDNVLAAIHPENFCNPNEITHENDVCIDGVNDDRGLSDEV